MKVDLISRSVALLALTINSFLLFAQTSLPSIPVMFVPKSETLDRDSEFLKVNGKDSKSEILLAVTGKKQHLNQLNLIGDFKTFIFNTVIKSQKDADALNIHFVAYDSKDKSEIPQGLLVDSELIMLFCAADYDDATTSAEDLGSTYFYLSASGQAYKVPASTERSWESNYVTKIVKRTPGLLMGLDLTDAHNRYKGDLTDTRSTFYKETNLREAFEDEVKYQLDSNHITITSVRTGFSAYTIAGDKMKNYGHRLIASFDFVGRTIGAQKDETIYIDEQPRFDKRPVAKEFMDNGHLCPLNCP